MIAGISKATALYLAPVLALTAVLLSLFAFLAPTLVFHDQVALLTVVPSNVLVSSGLNQTRDIDGPSVWLGPIGSCTRLKNDAPVNCTFPSIQPQYDLSTLPNTAPTLLLYAPSASTPIFITIALAFDVVFLITFTLLFSFRHQISARGGKIGNLLGTPALLNLCAGIGFGGFMVGLTAFLVLRMWFGKAVMDFNMSIQALGSQAPELFADIGNAFTMIWVAHAFLAIPVVLALTKYNIK